MDKALINLAKHAVVYAGNDDPACRLRYRFLTLLRDDPLYPIMEHEWFMVEARVFRLSGLWLEDGPEGIRWLYQAPASVSRPIFEARDGVIEYLKGKWHEAGGSPNAWPVPIGHFYGFVVEGAEAA